MGTKRCAIHERDASVASCRQCGKELCKSCVMVTPSGTFCSSECNVLHREFKSQKGSAAPASTGAMKGVLVVLLLLAAAFVIHLAPMTTGQPYDIIGMILNKAQEP